MGIILKNMKRYLQGPGECAYAAVTSAGNYHDKRINYEFVCNLMPPDGDGLYTPDIGVLLNTIGFTEVKVITADIDLVDFGWKNLSKKKLIEQMKNVRRRHPDQGGRDVARSYVSFLSDSKNTNELLVDMKFGQHIRSALDNGNPVLASFNWNLFFNFPKWNEYGEPDPIKGDHESHEILIYGYDEKGVRILDSHHEMYKGKLKKFGSGRYKMDWETLMTCMGFGDLIIPSGFSLERINEQLVCE